MNWLTTLTRLLWKVEIHPASLHPLPPVACDLEEDLCGFLLEDRNGAWLHTTSKEDHALHAVDHTYNSPYGEGGKRI